jgi:uncharacterized RDD family membrane protein YckC
VLTAGGALLRAAGLLPEAVTGQTGRILAQLAVFAVLTVPVTLWFAWSEAAPRGATPGKRVLGLGVVGLGGAGLSFGRSLGRSALKVALPWELAHTGVWNVMVWPAEQDAALDLVLFVLANALLAANAVLLLVASGRTLYDRAAGTVVRPVRPAAPSPSPSPSPPVPEPQAEP